MPRNYQTAAVLSSGNGKSSREGRLAAQGNEGMRQEAIGVALD